MPVTKDFGRVFAHRMEFPSKRHPFIERGWTQEIEEPYRRGVSMVFRLPCTTYGVAVGVWQRPREEEEALYSALGGRALGRYTEWDG